MNKLLGSALLLCGGLLATLAAAAEPPRMLHLAANFWGPYTSPELPQQGIASEIVVTALARAGYAAEISFMPWSRALALVYKGRIDGVVGVWLTSERRTRLAYSESYLSNDLYLFHVRPELCRDGALVAKTDLRIGVGRDYDYSDAFLAEYKDVLQAVDRTQQNLLKLRAGRIDLMLEDERAVQYLLRYQPQQAGEVAPQRCAHKPLLSLPLHLGIHRSYPNVDGIIAAFNAQLKAMKKDGSLQAILARQADTPPRPEHPAAARTRQWRVVERPR